MAAPADKTLVCALFAAACACGERAVPPAAPTGPATRAASPSTPASRLVRRVGRFSEDGRFAWSGSAVEARFRGRAIAAHLQAPPLAPHAVRIDGRTVWLDEKATTYAVTLDGRPLPPIAVTDASSPSRHVLARGLDPAVEHVVTLTREAEAFAGVHRFLGFDVEGGELLPPRPPPARRIEVVGDSIACGYGVLGKDASCPFTYETERASLAWPALVGRAVGADTTTLCWSGRGVYRNYDGSTSGTMPELFDKTLPEPPGAPFDFASAPAPDEVLIALGTNDFLGGAGEPVDLPAFEVAYARLLARLRAVYPRARRFVVGSPMIPPEVDADAALARIASASGAIFLSVPHQGKEVGCDHHPNAQMHRELAAVIGAALRRP